MSDVELAGESAEPLVVEWSAQLGPPIVLVSSYVVRARGVAERHGLPLITKPFDLAVLRAAVKAALATA